MTEQPLFVRLVFNDGDTYFAFWEDGDLVSFDEKAAFRYVEDWEEAAAVDIDNVVAYCDGDERDVMLKEEAENNEHCRRQIPKDWPRRPTDEDS